MSKEMNFFIYLLEKYADKKNKNASDILKEWDKLNKNSQHNYMRKKNYYF